MELLMKAPGIFESKKKIHENAQRFPSKIRKARLGAQKTS